MHLTRIPLVIESPKNSRRSFPADAFKGLSSRAITIIALMVFLAAIPTPLHAQYLAPQGVVASLSGHSVVLNWTASTSPGVTYDVYRDSTPIAISINGLTYTDITAPAGSHTYTVRANQESVDSNAVTVALSSSSSSAAILASAASGTFGLDGKWTAGQSSFAPSYALVTVSGENNWTWSSGITCWYNNPGFTFDVNFSDGTPHKLTLYAIDGDSTARAETITISDAASGVALNTQSLSSFQAGRYLSWMVGGHVKITVTRTAGSNAVVTSLFFN